MDKPIGECTSYYFHVPSDKNPVLSRWRQDNQFCESNRLDSTSMVDFGLIVIAGISVYKSYFLRELS